MAHGEASPSANRNKAIMRSHDGAMAMLQGEMLCTASLRQLAPPVLGGGGSGAGVLPNGCCLLSTACPDLLDTILETFQPLILLQALLNYKLLLPNLSVQRMTLLKLNPPDQHCLWLASPRI